MATQPGLFGDVSVGGAGEASSVEASPKAPGASPRPKAKPRRRANAVQFALSGESLPVDVVLGWRPAEDDGEHRLPEASDAPANDSAPVEPIDPFSSFPGRDFSPAELRYRDELRAIEQDPRSAWAQWLASRPQTRADCAADRQAWATDAELTAGKAPCRRFGCRYHLAVSVNPHGSLKIWWPSKDGGVAVDAMPETCALDVAEKHSQGLYNHDVAALLAMSEEGARLVIEEAMANVGAHAEALVGIRVPSGRVVHAPRREEPKEERVPVGETCAWHATGKPVDVEPDAWVERDCPSCEAKIARGIVSSDAPSIVEFLRRREEAIRAKRKTRRA